MKVSLVVAQGVHKGKSIPIQVAQFVIGREETCQLRPSSPAISKKHCAVLIKSGKIYLRDFGSTNGTFVNDQQISGEVEVSHNDRLRVGPLEFVLQVVATPASKSGSKSGISNKLTPPPKDEPTKEEKVAGAKAASTSEADAEQMAALLLSTDDGPPGPLTESSIPTGSTVFDVPVMNSDDPNAPKAPPPKPVDDRDNSKRAAEILKKYMQRPRQL
jgi:pSer/pThr/pTyr-binding forkhead associated (FHA) protein